MARPYRRSASSLMLARSARAAASVLARFRDLKLPGSMRMTGTPQGASSWRRASEIACTANFEALEAPSNGVATRPAVEPPLPGRSFLVLLARAWGLVPWVWSKGGGVAAAVERRSAARGRPWTTVPGGWKICAMIGTGSSEGGFCR